jgi:hypothetical protein
MTKEEFEEKVKKWIEIDNTIKIENEKIKNIQNQKKELNDYILKYANNNDLLRANFEIGDSVLFFKNVNSSQSLSFKYIEKCLNEIIEDKEKVVKIINYLKQNRENNTSFELKRIIK